jgi:hypothetical protein
MRDAVHGDLRLSQSIYDHVDAIARRLGADPKDQVPFEKYAKAAESLLKPSSAARAVANGAPFIERVDLLVKLISHQLGMPNADIDRTVRIVDQRLNERIVPADPACDVVSSQLASGAPWRGSKKPTRQQAMQSFSGNTCNDLQGHSRHSPQTEVSSH